MTNLMEVIDQNLIELELPTISDVVNNKRESIKYINKLLKQFGNKVAIPFDSALSLYDFRVKHVLFSFGLGIVLSSFNDLKNLIEDEYGKYKLKNSFIYTWLTLCLYHDFGYYIGESHLQFSEIEKIPIKYNIFDYSYCKSRYSKNLYLCYYKSKYEEQKWSENEYDISKNEEVGDHGILGGYVLFEKFYSLETIEHNEISIETTLDSFHLERMKIYQDICFRIMEHNVWKNEKIYENTNPLYEIDAEHFSKIDLIEPLLYLISLVDTIEMTKKFCRYSDESDEKEHFVYPKTLASKIKIKISDDYIEFDYSELELYIRKHKYFNNIDGWKESVLRLKDWVCVNTQPFENKTIAITAEKIKS